MIQFFIAKAEHLHLMVSYLPEMMAPLLSQKGQAWKWILKASLTVISQKHFISAFCLSVTQEEMFSKHLTEPTSLDFYTDQNFQSQPPSLETHHCQMCPVSKGTEMRV